MNTTQSIARAEEAAAVAVKVCAHPLRPAILRAITENEKMSPRELSDLLDAPLGNVSYHVRTLAGLKLIKLAGKVPRRGAIEHFYRVDIDRAVGLSDDLIGVAGSLRRAVNGDA